jgi:hypothetical protein
MPPDSYSGRNPVINGRYSTRATCTSRNKERMGLLISVLHVRAIIMFLICLPKYILYIVLVVK